MTDVDKIGLQVLYFAPKGQPHVSPGQRPGERFTATVRSPNGAALIGVRDH
jgi:hypothetical protein